MDCALRKNSFHAGSSGLPIRPSAHAAQGRAHVAVDSQQQWQNRDRCHFTANVLVQRKQPRNLRSAFLQAIVSSAFPGHQRQHRAERPMRFRQALQLRL